MGESIGNGVGRMELGTIPQQHAGLSGRTVGVSAKGCMDGSMQSRVHVPLLVTSGWQRTLLGGMSAGGRGSARKGCGETIWGKVAAIVGRQCITEMHFRGGGSQRLRLTNIAPMHPGGVNDNE